MVETRLTGLASDKELAASGSDPFGEDSASPFRDRKDATHVVDHNRLVGDNIVGLHGRGISPSEEGNCLPGPLLVPLTRMRRLAAGAGRRGSGPVLPPKNYNPQHALHLRLEGQAVSEPHLVLRDGVTQYPGFCSLHR